MISTRHLALSALLAVIVTLAYLPQPTVAGQGCPFDDGSCQDYCNQQGCNMGYCGHFAWIQCICRKCGDEWSWYDKVRFNPDKTVNQTELDSLKLNGTAPIILTNSGNQNVSRSAPVPAAADNNKKPATLTTLLIPDLSDPSGKLDLNDIPDENSDKFLEYLAKNHEKLAQATQGQQRKQQQAAGSELDDSSSTESSDDEQEDNNNSSTPSSGTLEDAAVAATADTIEIQISTSNNNTSEQRNQRTPVASASSTPASPGSPVTRLLKVAVMQRNSEEMDD